MKKILIIILIGFMLLASTVHADVGAKPSIRIYVKYNGEKIADSVFHAKMLGCYSEETVKEESRYKKIEVEQLNITEFDPIKDCYWYPSRFAWGGECKNSHCNFGYWPPEEFKLGVYIPSLNKTFMSGEVSRQNFYSTYEANLLSNGTIEMEETTAFILSDAGLPVRNFIIALIITLIIELVCVLIYINLSKINIKRYSGNQNRILFTVLLANIISLPIVWFIFPLMIKNFELIIILSEIFAIIYEGFFIKSLNKTLFTLKNALMLSFAINIISLFVGGYIFVFLTFFF